MIETDLFEFAYVPDWYGQLEQLAEMAFFGTLISMVLIATILPVLYWIVFDKHGKYSLRKKTSCE